MNKIHRYIAQAAILAVIWLHKNSRWPDILVKDTMPDVTLAPYKERAVSVITSLKLFWVDFVSSDIVDFRCHLLSCSTRSESRYKQSNTSAIRLRLPIGVPLFNCF